MANGHKSAKGMLLVIGLFAMGGLVLWGFFHARRVLGPPPVMPATTRAISSR